MIPACPPLPITGIDVWAVRLPLIEPFIISYGTFPDVPTVIVRVQTRDGLTGWGEATPDPGVTGETYHGVYATLLHDLLPRLIGRDARNREGALLAIERSIEQAPAARAAIDIALHDLLGKASGLPVWARGPWRWTLRTPTVLTPRPMRAPSGIGFSPPAFGTPTERSAW